MAEKTYPTNGKLSYGTAIRAGFCHLLANHENVFTIGQGLWAPWYVGSSMTDLDKQFGIERIIDSPVSETACTGAALGASLCGYRPIVIHPRIDFMILAVDQIVTQAAKWSSMFGGQGAPAVTIRGIVNRGGEQGAQHSQALHSWFAHIPGLRVAVPATVADARDLLIASTLCDDPVLYIDDRWLYDNTDTLTEVVERPITSFKPQILQEGSDITLVGASFSTQLCLDAAKSLAEQGHSAEVIDLRVINPLDTEAVERSVQKTRRLCVVDGGWETCGLAGEVIARTTEAIDVGVLAAPPARVTLPAAAAPTSKPLEQMYYPTAEKVCQAALKTLRYTSSELAHQAHAANRGQQKASLIN